MVKIVDATPFKSYVKEKHSADKDVQSLAGTVTQSSISSRL